MQVSEQIVSRTLLGNKLSVAGELMDTYIRYYEIALDDTLSEY